MANDRTSTNRTDRNRDDDSVDPRQNEPRRGLEGKGYDAGTGYGGAGNEALYSGRSSYGGQNGDGDSTFGGAYRGEQYGRSDDADRTPSQQASSSSPDQQGKGDLSTSARIPRGTDETAVNDAMSADRSSRTPRSQGDSDDDVDLDEVPQSGRRDPVR